MSCNCGKAKHSSCATEFQYAVKAVCGNVPECPPGQQPGVVAPGSYFTAINIHNPSKCDTASIRWKVAEAPPLPRKPIAPRDQRPFPLPPDQAREIDNPQILGGQAFLKGFVVLESSIELDVVAVYTGTQGPTWPMNTLHMERVPGRCVPVCEDLDLPIHTGHADWRILGSFAGGDTAALIAPPHTSWGLPPAGSAWIGASPDHGINAPVNGPTRTYQLAFDLCYGFTRANHSVNIVVSDSANVRLNSTLIGTVPVGPSTLVLPGSAFQAGTNVLRVQLTNGTGPGNGFALAGVLRFRGGRCPCSPLPLRQRGQEIPGASADLADEVTDPAE